MGESSKILFIIIYVCATTVLAEYYDVTTVYRFNKQEFDQNGELNTRYLDTCSVTVEPQTNAIGLPYYNPRDKQPISIKYPIANPTIPRLDITSNTSEWKTLSSDGVMRELPTPVALGGDYSELEMLRSTENIFGLIAQAVTLHEILINGDCISGHRSVFNSDIMSTMDKTNVFLRGKLDFFESTELYLIKGTSSDLSFDRTQSYLKIRSYRTLRSEGSNNALVNKLEICNSSPRGWNGKEDCEEHVINKCNFKERRSKCDVEPHTSFYFYINLEGTVKIYSTKNRKIYSTQKTHFDIYKYISIGCTTYHNQEQLLFSLVQLQTNHAFPTGINIVSQWLPIKNGTSLFIGYYRHMESSSSLNTHVALNIRELESLKMEKKSIMKTNSKYVDEIVKVTVTFPAYWVGKKQIHINADTNVYIRDIWEGGDSEIYRISSNQLCNESVIKDIYNIALKDPVQVQDTNVTFCSNGGFLNNSNETCICPPGFTGEFCEIACGRNTFGQECSKTCSQTDSECKETVLCKPSYGCTCPPGYHGDQCLAQCEEGTYGANCSQSCGQCQGGCDIYTGHCRGECDSPYMIWPLCKHPHSYWKGAPEIVGSSFNTVKLSLNFTSDNIYKSYDRTRLFMVQYKEHTDTLWTNGSYEIFIHGISQSIIYNLNPGRKYLFRVILVDETLRTSDPEFTKISEGLTECSVSVRNNDLHTTKSSNTSIELSWNEDTNEDTNECSFSSYIIEIDNVMDDGFVETRKIMDIKRKWFEINHLAPNKTYLIKLKKSILRGESTVVSSINITTNAHIDYSIQITGLIVNKTPTSEILLKWFQSALYKTYYIKYKLLKYLSCRQAVIHSHLQVISTKYTNHTLALEPNAQYQIFVTGDEEQMTNKANLTIITNGKLPSVTPTMLKNAFRATNESVKVQWSYPESTCQYMNGFFRKYFVQLLDAEGKVLKSSETYDRHMEFSELSPKTSYNIRVRYVNHIGYNPEVYLEHSFTTRATSFLTAQDLTAYKTSADGIGLRWKIPNNNLTVTGITMKIQNKAENKSLNITNLELLKCKAWPGYLCHNITQLKPNTKYAASINIFSEEFPEGGSARAIHVITRETVPSTVSDIKVEDISEKNLTVSWRIPFLLNGILRKFLIEVEHLSSFDETTCCQSIVTMNHLVQEEQEIYSHVIENIQTGSSYQITIRAFTKRLGQEVSKVIVIPPDFIPIKQKVQVKVDNRDVVWEEQTDNHTISSAENDLITDLLVIVQSSDNKTGNLEPSYFRTEMSRLLKSNNWWVAHVCKANEECLVHVGSGKESSSVSYGDIRNKPLTAGHNYTIVQAQVNKYLSAQSYTIARSIPLFIKSEVTTSTTMETPPQSTTQFADTTLTIQNELEAYLTRDQFTIITIDDDITEIPQDYDVPIPNVEEDL